MSAEPNAGNFNPRSPHGERRLPLRSGKGLPNFNPRSPHGERQIQQGTNEVLDISIHAPRTGSDPWWEEATVSKMISIHAPRTGSDADFRRDLWGNQHFNPRSPHGERPPEALNIYCHYIFQSTLPARGATHSSFWGSISRMRFQSTLPARGATVNIDELFAASGISIHAPRTGSDG